jgi:hypothetical protein
LEWQAPKTLLDGSSADISKFRFAFWEPVWYYEPTAKFPISAWKPARHLGFNDKSGDEFTYRVWTVDENDNWEKGGELTRNILRRRKMGDQPPTVLSQDENVYEALKFETARQRLDRRRQTKTKTVREKKAELASTRNIAKKRQRKRSDKSKSTSAEEENEPWTATVSTGVTLDAGDLTEDELWEQEPVDPLESLTKRKRGDSALGRPPLGLFP